MYKLYSGPYKNKERGKGDNSSNILEDRKQMKEW